MAICFDRLMLQGPAQMGQPATAVSVDFDIEGSSDKPTQVKCKAGAAAEQVQRVLETAAGSPSNLALSPAACTPRPLNWHSISCRRPQHSLQVHRQTLQAYSTYQPACTQKAGCAHNRLVKTSSPTAAPQCASGLTNKQAIYSLTTPQPQKQPQKHESTDAGRMCQRLWPTTFPRTHIHTQTLDAMQPSRTTVSSQDEAHSCSPQQELNSEAHALTPNPALLSGTHVSLHPMSLL